MIKLRLDEKTKREWKGTTTFYYVDNNGISLKEAIKLCKERSTRISIGFDENDFKDGLEIESCASYNDLFYIHSHLYMISLDLATVDKISEVVEKLYRISKLKVFS